MFDRMLEQSEHGKRLWCSLRMGRSRRFKWWHDTRRKGKASMPQGLKDYRSWSCVQAGFAEQPKLHAFPRLNGFGYSACKHGRRVERMSHSTLSGTLGTERLCRRKIMNGTES